MDSRSDAVLQEEIAFSTSMIKDILKRLMLVLLASAFTFSAHSQDEDAIKQIMAHRKKQDEEMRDPAKSPIEKKELKKFKGLNYFEPDLSYRVMARFVKNENPVVFKMKTSTAQRPQYLKYGEVHFTLRDTLYKLEVYQNSEISQMEGYEDYLFIPFTDKTNGKETYEVGRYLDVRIPKTEDIVLDFNLCYNPYCSYSPFYSCPIPPEANTLPTYILAGEKIYKTH